MLVKKNVLLSLVFRLVSIGGGIVLVPLSLSYLDLTSYGIWLTLSSILGWVGFFDIGLGNGLRNRLAESLAREDSGLARTYVSTTYGVLSGISLFLIILYLFVSPLLTWPTILRAPADSADELNLLALIVFSFLSIRFVTSLIGMVLTADQKPALNNGLDAAVSVASVVFVICLKKLTSGSLILLGSGLSLITVLLPLVGTFYFFVTRYRHLAPSLKFFRFDYARDLVSLGARFFILQAIFVIVFATGNLIITQLLGPKEVTPYNVAFKYFGFVTMIFSLLTVPLWSAFTDAYVRGDIEWIRRTVRKTIMIWVVLAIASVVMLFLSPLVYHVWVGDEVRVPFGLSVAICSFVLVMTWSTVFTMFINGVGKIKVQTISAVVVGIMNIPLSLFFAKYLGLGSTGVILGTLVCLLPGAVISPIQYRRIIGGTARGIWNE